MAAFNGDGHVLLMLTSTGMDKQALQSHVSSLTVVCHALCKAIDTVSTRRFRLSFAGCEGSAVGITRRPLMIMRCMANEDSTITQLADKLCISTTTAHQHMMAARKAMGTKTNIRAVLKAIKLGLIQVN
jgi:DNA-binding NarL/FixJ family response regulator